MRANQSCASGSDPRLNGSISPPLEVARLNAELRTVLVAGFRGALGAGMREILRRDEELKVIAGEGDVHSLVAEHRPDAALINHEALENVIDVRRVVAAHPETRVVMCVMRRNHERDVLLLEAGVRVVVPVTIDAHELYGVLRLAAHGMIGPPLLRRTKAGAGIGLLTKRETEVMRLLVLHQSARDIARELHVSETTVNTHRRRIYEKLGVHSRSELAQHASRILASQRRRDDFVPPSSIDRVPFRRLLDPGMSSGRPSTQDIRSALAVWRWSI